MRPDGSVAADPAEGVVRVGAARLAMAAAEPAGAWRFGGPAGPVLRALRFGERTEVVAAASALARPRDAIASAVLAAATVSAGSGERTLMEVLALWLAGAEWEAPRFTDTALLVGRAAGWPLQDLLAAPATEVDRLAVHLTEEQRGGGAWKSIVFLPPPAVDPHEIRARFVEELLRRAGASAEREDAAGAEVSKATTAGASPPKEPARSATTSSPDANRRKPRFRVIGAETGGSRAVGSPADRSAARRAESAVPVAGERVRAAAPEPDRGCHAGLASRADVLRGAMGFHPAEIATESRRPETPSINASVAAAQEPPILPSVSRAIAASGDANEPTHPPSAIESVNPVIPSVSRGIRTPTGAAELTPQAPVRPDPSTHGRDDRFAVTANAAVARNVNTNVAVELHPTREFVAAEPPDTHPQDELRLHVADGHDREFFTSQTPPRAATRTAHDHTDALFTALQAATPATGPFDVARELAALLDDEADLRGLDR